MCDFVDNGLSRGKLSGVFDTFYKANPVTFIFPEQFIMGMTQQNAVLEFAAHQRNLIVWFPTFPIMPFSSVLWSAEDFCLSFWIRGET